MEALIFIILLAATQASRVLVFDADARRRADSVKLAAEAQAEANRMVAESLSEEIIFYEAVKRWNGVLPKMVGMPGNILLQEQL